MNKLHYRTIVLSDIHLGTKDSKTKEITNLLEKTECETLIFNGDIVDGWALKHGSKWSKAHTRCLRQIIQKAQHTKVYWIRGNHDDFLKDFVPTLLGNFSLIESFVYKGLNGKKYLVTHGDVFDTVVNHMRFVAIIGSISYQLALGLNRWYNKYREWRGLEYFSLSQKMKQSVKAVTGFIGKFEQSLANYAHNMKCDGVICGHIHKAEMKHIDGIEYLNSGDWVESLTALVETTKGEWKIITYKEFLKELSQAS